MLRILQKLNHKVTRKTATEKPEYFAQHVFRELRTLNPPTQKRFGRAGFEF